MKVEQAKQIVSTAIEQLSQALESGHSESVTGFWPQQGQKAGQSESPKRCLQAYLRQK